MEMLCQLVSAGTLAVRSCDLCDTVPCVLRAGWWLVLPGLGVVGYNSRLWSLV